MSTEITRDLEKVQKDRLQADFQGKASNQFIDDVKASTIFQFDSSELSYAAPAALSAMASCWMAAGMSMADRVQLKESQPNGGFKHLTNRSNPTLRSCLFDVGQVGGTRAFMTAGTNMEGLRITSARIVIERIPSAFQLLGQVTRGPDQLEDFNDNLDRLLKEVNHCSALAKETKDAFTKWGLMCAELQSCCEAQITTTSIKRNSGKIDEEIASIAKQFAVQANDSAEKEVKQAKDQVDKAEKRLDTLLSNAPGQWGNFLQTAISGWTQAIPHIVAGVIPSALTASNPVAAAAMAQGPTVNDPAYPAATAIQALVTYFSDYLESSSGRPDWLKFTEASKESSTVTGIVYLLENFTGQKSKLDLAGTEPNKKFAAALDMLIKVATSIKDHLAKQNNIAAPQLDEGTLTSWKTDVRKAKTDVIELATVDSILSSNNMPNPFTIPKVEVAKPDLATRTAQTNIAQQSAAVAQVTADLAADSYNKLIERQSKTASTLSDIQQKLKNLQETGKTLEEIKAVLRDAISVLVDMTVQFGKLEQFFKIISSVITLIILPKVKDIEQDMNRPGGRGSGNKIIQSNVIAQQTIYMAMLQIRGYSSLLNDIASMYCEVQRSYITQGIELCQNLSRNAARGEINQNESERLARYVVQSDEQVRKLVKEKQNEVLKSLRDRARKAGEDATKTTKVSTDAGYPAIDDGTKKAIEAAKEASKSEAEKILDCTGSPLAQSQASIKAIGL